MFKKHVKNDLIYYTIPSFDATGLVKHCFTTRKGGVSKGEFESLNLGLSRNDNRENVLQNFQIICEALHIDVKNLVLSSQIHKDKIHQVQKCDAGKGIWKESDIIGVDSLITNIPNLALTTFYADCVPLYFLDPINKAIGLAHAGWGGTVLKIGKKTVHRMQEAFGSRPEDLLVAIAPSIGDCCFEVEWDVVAQFRNTFEDTYFIRQTRETKYHIDLWEANKISILEAGVQPCNITLSELCTMCHKDEFFSHRGHKGKRGNLAAILQLNE